MYLIIGMWGYERRVYAAVKFFLYDGRFRLPAGGHPVPVLPGELHPGRPPSTWAPSPASTSPRSPPGALPGVLRGVRREGPAVPLHTLAPDAHTEAPTARSVILAGVLLKIGAYGLIRFNLVLFPEASDYFREFVLALAVIGIVYGAVVALIQRDLKRLVAYSSVSHLGFVVLGIFAGTLQGMTRGVIQMRNHGLSTGALFLLVGMLYDRLHTRDLGQMGGLASRMPLLSGLFLVVALSSSDFPG